MRRAEFNTNCSAVAAALSTLFVLGWPAPAQAQPPNEASGAAATDTTQSPPRALPLYDGRIDRSAEGDGAGVWIGRIVLSPFYLVSEFVLRRPLGALTVAAERADLPNKVYDFFAFGPEHKIGFYPVGLFEFGFLPSFGIYAFWDDALVKNNHFRLHYETWPPDFGSGKIKDEYDVDDNTALLFNAAGVIRPDQVFYGLGPNSLHDHQSRYKIARFDASAAVRFKYWRSGQLEVGGGVHKVDISNGHWGSDPSLLQEAATGAFPVPFGFNRGYIAPFARAVATFDPHPRDIPTGSGVRVVLGAESGADVQHELSGWIRYAAAVKGYVDLNDRGRILSLTLGTLFADPIGPNPIPFTELVSLGGDEWMYGYFEGRLRGRSAAVASLDYKWPIGPRINGVLQVATGNVFDTHLDDFDIGLFRLSWSLGMALGFDPPVEALIGFGTETFNQGTRVDSVRLYLGVPRSF